MISENATCAWSKPWTGSNFFLRLWIELTFCINLAMHMLFDGKLFLSQTNWSIQRIFNFCKNSAYIVHGTRPFKFARCAIILLFELNGNPALRVTSEFLWGSIRVSEANLLILVPYLLGKQYFSTNFMVFTYHGCTMVNLGPAQYFSSAYGSSWGFA